MEDPQLCAIVVVDDPHAPANEMTGGLLAAPIFAEIMQHSLNHLAVSAHTTAQTDTVKGDGR